MTTRDQAPPNGGWLDWTRCRDGYLPYVHRSLGQAEAISRTFLKPKKTYLRTPNEIIIYFSIRSSEETFRLFAGFPGPWQEANCLAVLGRAYDLVLRNELSMAFNLFSRWLRPIPPVSEYRKLVFLARYEGDGPSGSSETEAEAQIAHRFFEAAKVGFYGPDGQRQMMGNVYNMIWQTGHYILEYYLRNVDFDA